MLVSVFNLSGLHIDDRYKHLCERPDQLLIASSITEEFSNQPLKGFGVVEGIGEEKGKKIRPILENVLLLHILIEVDEIGNVLTRHQRSDEGACACAYHEIELEVQLNHQVFDDPCRKSTFCPSAA